MTVKNFLIRFAALGLFSFLGAVLFAMTFNALIMLNLTPQGEEATGFGNEVTFKTVFVFLASVIAGFGGIFVRDNWRWVLVLCPLYAPSVFTILYTLFQ